MLGLGRLIGQGIVNSPRLLGGLLGGVAKIPGRFGEGLVGGLTGQPTRKIMTSAGVAGRINPGEALPSGANYASGTFRGMGKTASIGQALGYGGTLAGVMAMGDHDTVDEYGTKLPGADDDVIAAREKFQKDRLGGSSKVTKAKYDALKASSPWVMSAIQRIGKEKYIEMVKAMKAGEISPEQLHSVMTDAIANDTEAMKMAGKEAYMLPGISQEGETYNVYFMNPNKGKDGKTKWGVMPFQIE